MRRPANRALVAIFLGTLGLPLAATLAGVDGAGERREMAAFPALDGAWTSVAGYPAGLARWFDDHFAFRATLVEWDARLRLFGLRSSPSLSVMLGKDGWLFYADDGASEDIAGTPAMSEPEVQNWRETVTRAKEWSKARAIAFVFVIAPDKHTIYQEQLPESVRSVGTFARADQVFAALTGSGDQNVATPAAFRDGFAIDLRPALFEAKSRERLYHLTDTHWNEHGAFVAYGRIIDALRLQHTAIPPAWPRSDFNERGSVQQAGDLARMLGLARVMREERLLLEPRRPRRARVVEPADAAPTDEEGRLVTEIPGSGLPRAVIFRDSFVSPMVPFLSEHFSRAVYLWEKDFVVDPIIAERPDVVIYEIVGRHLYTFTPSPELIPK